MDKILEDEISHVAFGWNWLKKLKPLDQTEWDTWIGNLPPLMTPHRARGFKMMDNMREKAGVSTEWIDNLKKF
jgi:uncharacterized ferritin-like protein (DUF455 family)